MERADDLDMRILRELLSAGGPYLRSDRVSLETVARVVGIHRSTVSERLANLSRTGVLRGFTIDIEPAAIGIVAMHVQYRVSGGDRDRTVRLASLVEGVSRILILDQGWVSVMLYADSVSARDRATQLLAEIFRPTDRRVFASSADDFPDVKKVPITKLDARLLVALLADSRQTPSALATITDVSTRTVERRLARLQAAGVYFVLPRLDVGFLRGLVQGMLVVNYPGLGWKLSVT